MCRYHRLGIGSGIGAAAVLFRNGEEKCTLRKYLGKEGEHTVFEAEVMGLALAAELVRAETHMDAAEIGTDSQAALRATRNTRGHRDSTCWTSTKRGWRRRSAGTERTLSRSGGPQGMTALLETKERTLRQKRPLTVTQARPVSSPDHAEARSRSADRPSDRRTTRGSETRQPASSQGPQDARGSGALTPLRPREDSGRSQRTCRVRRPPCSCS